MSRSHLVLRAFQILLVGIAAAFHFLFRMLTRKSVGRDDPERIFGEVLARTLERLGATFIKFGQILGSRPDLVGPGITDALAPLHDAVPPCRFEELKALLEAELGEARAQIVTLCEQPIAAASVAQVHEGTLQDGSRVAVKIQRPKAKQQIEGDLALLRLIAALADRVPSLQTLSLPGSVERFATALHQQLDFRLELANNLRFRDNFSTIKGVRVPHVYPDLSTERVLTMEFIDGEKATEPQRIKDRKARRRLARRGADAILRMVFQDGFVHADLHPGNILLMADGTLVFIDLGMVAEIPPEMMAPWIATFSALAEQDGRRVAQLFYRYAPRADTRNYRQFEDETTEFFHQFAGKKLGEVEVSHVVGGMMNILRRHHVHVQPAFTVVNLGVLVAEGIGKQLDPDIDIVQTAIPYLVEAAAKAPEAMAPLREIPS